MSEHPPTTSHNFMRIGAELALKAPVSVLTRLEGFNVTHDPWCDHLRGVGCCNCNPDVSIIELRRK